MKAALYIAIVFMLTACYVEKRADDFSLDYNKEHLPFFQKFEEGTITNLSSLPAEIVKLKIKQYHSFGLLANTTFETVKGGIDPNQQKRFCYLLADSITSVSISVSRVD